MFTLAAMSSSMLLESPHNNAPTPKTEYPNSIDDLRPKTSLNFPYNGWNPVRVSIYLSVKSISFVRHSRGESVCEKFRCKRERQRATHPVAIQGLLLSCSKSLPIRPYKLRTMVLSRPTRRLYDPKNVSFVDSMMKIFIMKTSYPNAKSHDCQNES